MTSDTNAPIDPPVSDAAYLRLAAILRAGEIEESRAAAERLAAIAQYSVDMAAHRARIPRTRPKLPRRRRRPNDPPPEKLLRKRGRPANREMRELFANLVGFWLDHANAVPGVSFNDLTNEYTGRFVRFAQAFCGAFLSALEAAGSEPAIAPHLGDLVKNPVRVRTWLRAVYVPQFATQETQAVVAFRERSRQKKKRTIRNS